MISAITVCVNYSDFLKHTIKVNKEIFYEYLVVTRADDWETQTLCQESGVKYIISERVSDSDGEGFHKGKAINDGILHLTDPDWVCNIDADILLDGGFRGALSSVLPLNVDCLYGFGGRILLETPKQLQELREQTLILDKSMFDTFGDMVGYFHLWNTKTRPFYPEVSHHAGFDDVLMRDSFQRKYWRKLPGEVFHLGPLWLNHSGRKTERFK